MNKLWTNAFLDVAGIPWLFKRVSMAPLVAIYGAKSSVVPV